MAEQASSLNQIMDPYRVDPVAEESLAREAAAAGDADLEAVA
jgi:hypothetical protein